MRSVVNAWWMVVVAVLVGSPVALAQPCEAGWVAGEFVLPGLNGPVFAAAEFDDGRGPALYVGGDFTIAGGVVANGVARWDGERWEALGNGVNGRVHALAVYDDGGGEALYVGGWFDRVDGEIVRGLARWDGAAWSWPPEQLYNCTSSGCRVTVLSMAVYDDGRGDALYVGGDFTRVQGLGEGGQLFRYDGAWSRPGGLGVQGGEVYALAVHDQGDGAALYVGGTFQSIGGVLGPYIAKLSGQTWSSMGEATRPVIALQGFELDGEPALFASGEFVGATGGVITAIGAWDGAAWRRPGQAMTTTSSGVTALAIHDTGAGPRLFAAGSYRLDGSFDSVYLATLEGGQWEAALDDDRLAVSVDIETLVPWEDAGGPTLLLGGDITRATGDRIAGLARWYDGLVEPFGPGMPGTVSAMAASPTEGVVYVAMGRPVAGGLGAVHTAYAWDGRSLEPLGGAFDGDVRGLAVLDTGGTPTLYAGGDFETVDGADLGSVVRWDGAAWRSTGAGRVIRVERLEIANLGEGPRLYALGSVSGIGGLSTSGLARLAPDGTSWEALGSGAFGTVRTIEVFDAGHGPMLYAGGDFDTAGGIAAENIARWDPGLGQWFDVGGGASGWVWDLAVYDDGRGPALYAGGYLTVQAPGEPRSRNIGRWNGEAWRGVDVGVSGSPPGGPQGVFALHPFDDGSGERLFIGGSFFGPGAGTDFGPSLIAWDGAEWSGIGSADGGVTGFQLVEFDGDLSLMASGSFDVVNGDVVSINLARYQGCDACPADLDGDGELAIFDFLMFGNLFDAGDPAADFDGDGAFTVFDFLAFQNAFDAGCP